MAEMDASIYMKRDYEDFCVFGRRKNKANSKPIQTQSKPDTNGAGGIPRRHRAPDTGHDSRASNPRGICFASTDVRSPLTGAGGIRTPVTFR